MWFANGVLGFQVFLLRRRARLVGALCYARGFSAHGFCIERARIAGALRYARGFKISDCRANGFSTEWVRLGRGTSLRSWFEKKVPACRAHGFSTERARLAGALRFARDFKKSACYLAGF